MQPVVMRYTPCVACYYSCKAAKILNVREKETEQKLAFGIGLYVIACCCCSTCRSVQRAGELQPQTEKSVMVRMREVSAPPGGQILQYVLHLGIHLRS